MKYYMEIKHEGLNKYKRVTGSSPEEVREKAYRMMQEWDEKWEEELAKREKEKRIQEGLKKAEERTKRAQEKLSEYNNFLKNHLESPPTVLEDTKDSSEFNEPEPWAEKIDFLEVEPLKENFKPKIWFFERKNEKKVAIKTKKAEEEYTKALDEYNRKYSTYKADKDKFDKLHREWEKHKILFYENQKKHNMKLEKDYERGDRNLIIIFANKILTKFSYPENFKKEFEVDYNPDNKILIVDFKLPTMDNLTKLKEVTYNKSKDSFKNNYISKSELEKLYDNLLYQIALACINDLYKADCKKVIESIVFNGWLDTVDAGIGKDITVCIISIQISREEFNELTLSKVDPKECFKRLKGVGSSQLHYVTPVAPIMEMNKNDKRFIPSYGVMDGLDESENLAVMDWQDFEHLIRELFEEEFSQNGGEVKVTQSSKDGGVDAIAFDPDPIRGGKIVIQAKRYTNIVGVSAVRDLYGTLLNEGAIKGILVTTSDYGSDAYNFVKDKPLTLINGANLLHLLEKYGRKAKIDLKEAKMLLNENK